MGDFYVSNTTTQRSSGGGGGGGGAAFSSASPLGFDAFGGEAGGAAAAVGEQLLREGVTRWRSNLDRFVDLASLRFYFQVSNSYVLNKLKRLMFPFAFSQWAPRGGGLAMDGCERRVPPRDDINAPDLYIPSMAFVSYILVTALVHGLAEQFTPEVLGATASAGFLALGYEVAMLKAGTYLLSSSTPLAVMDAVALAGYKFVSLLVCTACGLAFGQWGFYAALAVCGVLMSVFLVRTLSCYWAVESGPRSFRPTKRTYFMLAVTVHQFALLWLMGAYRQEPRTALRASAT